MFDEICWRIGKVIYNDIFIYRIELLNEMDQAKEIGKEEALDWEKLGNYLRSHLPELKGEMSVAQFHHGHAMGRFGMATESMAEIALKIIKES